MVWLVAGSIVLAILGGAILLIEDRLHTYRNVQPTVPLSTVSKDDSLKPKQVWRQKSALSHWDTWRTAGWVCISGSVAILIMVLVAHL